MVSCYLCFFFLCDQHKVSWQLQLYFQCSSKVVLYELVSALLSSSFLGICSLVFSETLYGVSVTETPFWQWSKMTQECFFFWLFREIYSLALSGNGIEWKYLWPSSILHKQHMCYVGKMWFSSYGNQISVFFNHQQSKMKTNPSKNILLQEKFKQIRQVSKGNFWCTLFTSLSSRMIKIL